MALNLAISGNAYAIIQRLGAEVVGLLPVSSAQVVTSLLDDGTVIHTYTTGQNVKVYSSESMWHIKLFGNGIVGLSPLSYARNSIGIAIGADNRVSTMYGNGAKPSGVLTIDKVLTAEQRTAIKQSFIDLETGNSERLFVLEAGMQYQQISMTPKDIQLLDSRRFQIEDIGRFFGVPSVLLNQTFGQSSLGSNVYEILSAFYKLNLRPYLEKIEASVPRWLMAPADAERYQCEFDFDAALLRADLLTRMQSNREAINSGQMTPNEARISEGRPKLAGGDQLLIQGAMIPIQQAGQKPAEVPNAAQKP
jgi:HK97 family phage portal protein